MSHYIYVIGREEGPVKVGISKNPRSRLDTLQTGCPFRISLLHVEECRDRDHARWHEESFHDVYSNVRLEGEWFNLESDLAIEGIETGFQMEEHFGDGSR